MSVRLLFAALLLGSSSVAIAQNDSLGEADVLDAQIVLGPIKHVRNMDSHGTKGFERDHVQSYGMKAVIDLKSNQGSASFERPMWITMSSSQMQNLILSNCRNISMDGLKDQRRSLKIIASQIPYHHIMKDPEDLYSAKVSETKANRLMSDAKADLARAQADYKVLAPQIEKLIKDAAAAKLAGHKKNLLAQAEALQKRALARIDQAKKNYERDMNAAMELRERAKAAREKLAARAKDVQERIANHEEAIANLKARIEKLDAAGKKLEADKLAIQMQMKVDQMERLQAELEDMKPGARAHIGFNLDRVKVSCE